MMRGSSLTMTDVGPSQRAGIAFELSPRLSYGRSRFFTEGGGGGGGEGRQSDTDPHLLHHAFFLTLSLQECQQGRREQLRGKFGQSMRLKLHSAPGPQRYCVSRLE